MVRRTKPADDLLEQISGISRYVPPLDPAQREKIIGEVVREAQAASELDRDRGSTPQSFFAFNEAALQARARVREISENLSTNVRRRIAAGTDEQKVNWDDVNAAYRDLPTGGGKTDHLHGGPFQAVLDLAELEITGWGTQAREASEKRSRLADNARMARNEFGKKLKRLVDKGTETPLTTAAIIVLSVVIEIVVNGYFFLNATEQGMAGAVAEVFGFAPASIGLAVVLGLFSLRYRSILQPKFIRWIATATSYIIPILILLLNLVLAIARLSFTETVRQLSSAPRVDRVTLEKVIMLLIGPKFDEVITWDAIAIFLLAIFLAAYAAYKAFHLYDPEPGFSKLCQRYRERKKEYDRSRVACETQLETIFKKANDALNKSVSDFFMLGARYRVIQEAIDREILYYEENARGIVGFYDIVTSSFHGSYGDSAMIDVLSLPAFEPLDEQDVKTPVDDERNAKSLKQTMAAIDALNAFGQDLLGGLNKWHQDLVEELGNEIFERRFR